MRANKLAPQAPSRLSHLWPMSTSQGVRARSTPARSAPSQACCALPGPYWCSVDMTVMCRGPCSNEYLRGGRGRQGEGGGRRTEQVCELHASLRAAQRPQQHVHARRPACSLPALSASGRTRAARAGRWWAWASARCRARRTRRRCQWWGTACGPPSLARGCQWPPAVQRPGATTGVRVSSRLEGGCGHSPAMPPTPLPAQ